MLISHVTALVLASVCAVNASEIAPKKPIKMDFSVLRGNSRSSATKAARPRLVKKYGSTELILDNEQTYYAATLKIGSQGAENTVIVDTGSSDLWIMSSDVSCSYSRSYYRKSMEFGEFHKNPEMSRRRLLDFEVPTLASEAEKKEKRADVTTIPGASKTAYGSSAVNARSSYGGTCTSEGSFNTAESDSFNLNSTAPDFLIHYADETYASGVWGHDYVDFGSSNVSDCSFAVANDTSSHIGVFGIGLAELEMTYSSNSSTTTPYTYENFPVRLKSTGQINKVMYSLYLNSADAQSGSVLFGAVDHAKYSGQLQTVPVVNRYSEYYDNPLRFDIVLDSITLENSSQNVTVSTSHIPALLDSGTTLTYLPTDFLYSLVSSLGGWYSFSGYYRVSCSYNTTTAHAVFNFSGAKIRVPMADLILSSQSLCYLGVVGLSFSNSSSSPYAILGDNFLRSAYVVYDLEDYEISLAQAEFSDTEDIEVVSSSVPSAVRASGYSSTAVASSIDSDFTTSRFSPPAYTSARSSSSSSSRPKSSEGTSAIHFARSLLFTLLGAGVLFVI
ncbi:hypothetical protein OXX69_011270 [Metschnikowia pulcherrima]